MKWILVEDQLPKKGRKVLAQDNQGNIHLSYLAHESFLDGKPLFGYWRKNISDSGGFMAKMWLPSSLRSKSELPESQK